MTGSTGSKLLWSGLAVAALLLVDHPLLLAGLTAAVVTVLARHGLLDAYAGYARYAAVLGLTLLALNPLLAPLGRTVLARATFTLPLVGRPVVTLEALAFGATGALRLVALLGPFVVVAHDVDAEELFAAMRSVGLPASGAMATALSIRFLPTMADDARRIRQAQRARGLAVGGVRDSPPVLAPLLSRSIDRGMDLAEALAARGFGSGPRTRIETHGGEGGPWPAVAAAIPVGFAVAGFGSYAFYPVLDPLLPGPLEAGFAVAATAALMLPAARGWST